MTAPLDPGTLRALIEMVQKNQKRNFNSERLEIANIWHDRALWLQGLLDAQKDAKLSREDADALENELRRLEADPNVSKMELRLFLQCPMPCGHAAGNLLTCSDPPYGCVVCGEAGNSKLDALPKEPPAVIQPDPPERAYRMERVEITHEPDGEVRTDFVDSSKPAPAIPGYLAEASQEWKRNAGLFHLNVSWEKALAAAIDRAREGGDGNEKQ